MNSEKFSIKKLLSISLVYLAVIVLMSFSVSATQTSINLGSANDFVILAKSGVSTTGASSITGDIGTSPIDSTAITGFGLIMDSSNRFSKSSIVTGKIYAADYSSPTPNTLTSAISDMQTAYIIAAGRSLPDYTELGAGDISEMTLSPGLYKWGTGVLINNDLTISGNENDVWVFQIAQDLNVGNGAKITLSGGALAENIFWQVGGATTLGTTSDFKGIILSKAGIAMNTGASLEGRAFAQTAVTLDATTLVAPTESNVDLDVDVVVDLDETNTNDDTDNNDATNTNADDEDSEFDEECGKWSDCSLEGIRTRSCTQKNSPYNLIKTSACVLSDSNDEDSSVRNQENNLGIGQELNRQISVRKSEIKSGDYTNSLGQELRVHELSRGLKQINVNGVTVRTYLNISAQSDSNGKSRFRTKLNNGQEVEIKIMPDTASKKALETLRIKSCSSDNNCTIELKSVGNKSAEKIQYEMQLERHSKILGIFQKKMDIRANVDAQTGNTTMHKPWWAFMAVESSE